MRIYNPNPSVNAFPFIDVVEGTIFVVYDYDDTYGEYIFDVADTMDEAQELLIQ